MSAVILAFAPKPWRHATIVKRDRWMTKIKDKWYVYAMYDFGGDSLYVRLFDNMRGYERFRDRRVKHSPMYYGRVRFK